MDADQVPEVPEFAGNADLLEGPDALRPEPDEGGDPEARLRRPGRRLLRLRPGVSAQAAPVVASCGTALTPQQAQLLRRFTSKVVLSYDPDAAGQGAAARSCELLVAEGFEVNVVVLDKGEDPDTFIRRNGAGRYRERLRTFAAVSGIPARSGGRGARFRPRRQPAAVLGKMLTVAARIPDAAARDQFARPDRPQGAYYRRGRPGRNPQGGGQPADRR